MEGSCLYGRQCAVENLVIAAPAVTGMHADIETFPTERCGRLVDRRLHRHVGGESGASAQQQKRGAAQPKLFHSPPQFFATGRPVSAAVRAESQGKVYLYPAVRV
jgi:hypothetical protein